MTIEHFSGGYVINPEGLWHVAYKLMQLRMKNGLIAKQKGRVELEHIKAMYEKRFDAPMFPPHRLHREQRTRRQAEQLLRKVKVRK